METKRTLWRSAKTRHRLQQGIVAQPRTKGLEDDNIPY